jgi:hypothetical protein
MTTLTQANREWSTRAADERFPSVEAMHERAKLYRLEAREAALSSPKQINLVSYDDELGLIGRTGKFASMTNWSFSQVCREAEAPASYLKTLPAPYWPPSASRVAWTWLLDRELRLLFNQNGSNTLRAITSPYYSRIWNQDVTQRLVDLKHSGQGWQEAPKAFDGSRGTVSL